MSSPARNQVGHRLFKAGIWLKGTNGALELIGGLLLATIPLSLFTKTILFLTQHDAGSSAKDWAFRELSQGLSQVFGESTFAIFYLLSHGAVKVGLAIALLREIRWAYPVALGVFGLLAGYEVYRFVVHPGVMMAIIIAIDLGVCALIGWHWRSESKNRSRHPHHAKKPRASVAR